MELRLPNKDKNKDGTFRKKFVPWNKGLKMKNYLSPEMYAKVMGKLKRTGNPNLPGANRKEVYLLENKRITRAFKSSHHAARAMKLHASLIRKVCRGERNTTGGHQFFYAENYESYKHLIK